MNLHSPQVRDRRDDRETAVRTKLILPVVAVLLVTAMPVHAGEFAVLKTELETARKELVSMILYREKRGPEQQKKVKDTADAVSAHLARMKAPEGRAAQFKELKETWAAFKTTRETELVPAILAGEKEKAEKTGAGIQKERLEKCYALIPVLDK